MIHTCTKHPAGTLWCYNKHACRCPDCREALRKYQSARRRTLAYGKPLPQQVASQEESDQARAKLRALVALGWSTEKIGREMGIVHSAARRLILGSDRFQQRTLPRVEAVYDRLSMRVPKPVNQYQRAGVTKTKNMARRNGWVPPLELEAAGLPEVGDNYLDEQAIWRRMDGDKSVRLSRSEQLEAWQRWDGSTAEFEQVTGISVSRMRRLASRNRPASQATREAA